MIEFNKQLLLLLLLFFVQFLLMLPNTFAQSESEDSEGESESESEDSGEDTTTSEPISTLSTTEKISTTVLSTTNRPTTTQECTYPNFEQSCCNNGLFIFNTPDGAPVCYDNYDLCGSQSLFGNGTILNSNVTYDRDSYTCTCSYQLEICAVKLINDWSKFRFLSLFFLKTKQNKTKYFCQKTKNKNSLL